MNQQETEALATELAGTECQTCDGVGGQEEGAGECANCHGTGYLFDASVRVPCNSVTIRDDMDRLRHFHIGIGWADGCRGWTASMDRRVWEPAVSKAGYKVDIGWMPFTKYLKIPVRLPNGKRNDLCDDTERLLTALAQKELGGGQ